jgi:hypothetical protein
MEDRPQVLATILGANRRCFVLSARVGISAMNSENVMSPDAWSDIYNLFGCSLGSFYLLV